MNLLFMVISLAVLYESEHMKTEDDPKHHRWRVYILQCNDGSLYTGATKDLGKRLAKHNTGKASKYTQSRRPVSIVAASGVMKKGEALRLEHQIKKMPKTRKVDCLKSHPDGTMESRSPAQGKVPVGL